MRAACAARVAAGVHVPMSLRSAACHYEPEDVRKAFPEEVAEKSAAIRAHRDRLNDREWAFRPANAFPGPLSKFEGLNVRETDAK
jgi:hypothetical protein